MGFPSFNTGEVLAAADMNAVGMWLVKTQTIGSAVSSVAVSNAFNSSFENYRITINSGVASVATNIRLQLGSSTTGYYTGGSVWAYTTGTAQTITDNNAASFTRAGQASTDAIFMDCTLFSPNLVKRTSFHAIYALPGTAFTAGTTAGFHNVAAAYTDFTITADSGNLTGGTIRIYGLRN